MKIKTKEYITTRNACKLCTPLGASAALKGFEKTMILLHGSQGCSTYIRRYMISHFKEPIDIASSNFSEESTIFGGASNLKQSLKNVTGQYSPKMIGIATTCLSETIGEDANMILREYREENPGVEMPDMVTMSTPSYRGTHIDGFHEAVRAVVTYYAEGGDREDLVNIMPNFVSPEDMRQFKEILDDFGINYLMLPDYSATLDGPMWTEYQKIPDGGTSLESIKSAGKAVLSFEMGDTLTEKITAGKYLEEKFGVKKVPMGIPIGITETDILFNTLSAQFKKPIPAKYADQRGRLIDAYADGHKYIFEKKAVIYGEDDLVIAMAKFMREIGMIPVLCATGGKNGLIEKTLRKEIPDFDELGIEVREGADFLEIDEITETISPDIMIGNSKGFKTARKTGIPLLRVGFPIHDRFGGQRILHTGYKGTQELFDKIVNIIIEGRQKSNDIGYSYI